MQRDGAVVRLELDAASRRRASSSSTWSRRPSSTRELVRAAPRHHRRHGREVRGRERGAWQRRRAASTCRHGVEVDLPLHAAFELADGGRAQHWRACSWSPRSRLALHADRGARRGPARLRQRRRRARRRRQRARRVRAGAEPPPRDAALRRPPRRDRARRDARLGRDRARRQARQDAHGVRACVGPARPSR